MKKLLDVVKEKTGAGKAKPDLRGFGKTGAPDFVLRTFLSFNEKKSLRTVKDV